MANRKIVNSKWLVLLCMTCLFASCDSIVSRYVDLPEEFEFLKGLEPEKKTPMEVMDVTFSPDFKTFTVATRMTDDGPIYSLTDSIHLRTEVVEIINGVRRTHSTTPCLSYIRNTEAEGLAANDVRMLVLVDRTMPQSQLDKVQTYVGEMRTIFSPDRLFLSFMDGDNITPNVKATDYVINNYFKQSSESYIFLYRAMQTKLGEIIKGENLWEGAHKRAMIIFSEGNIYDDESETPIDPEHYRFEEQLIRRSPQVADTAFIAFYVNMKTEPEETDQSGKDVAWIFCNNYGGEYLSEFRLTDVKWKMYDAFHFDFPDNEFIFVNPDLKVYRGDVKELTLNFYDRKTNKLVTFFTTSVQFGLLYRPIIVHGHSFRYMLIQGVLLAIFLLLLVYFIMQVIVPVIRYLLFRHRYVISYAGANMSFEGKQVAQSCYLCKAPFQQGDSIVVKCEHTMHESCWEENEYHCPEYSDRCKHGSHYFNRYSLFDIRNASFYMKWILAAIGAALMAWITFLGYIEFHFDESIIQPIMRPPVSQLPFLGSIVAFFIMLAISGFTVSAPGWRKGLEIIGRSLIAGVISYLIFLLFNGVILLFGISHGVSVINGLAWVIASFVIIFCAIIGTRVAYNKKLLILTVIMGGIAVFGWSIFSYRTELDYRVLMLLILMIYYVGMACCVASYSPRSERYFLKVEGAVKTMDIALYKWFRNHPDRVVTIGKSVDCSLQLSWDMHSHIAPVQAELCFIHKVPYLIALEPGVFIKNKPVKLNKKIRLYHGKQFSIGQNTFTYVEKDH